MSGAAKAIIMAALAGLAFMAFWAAMILLWQSLN